MQSQHFKTILCNNKIVVTDARLFFVTTLFPLVSLSLDWMDRLTKRFNPYHYMYVCTKRKPSGLINVREDGFV